MPEESLSFEMPSFLNEMPSFSNEMPYSFGQSKGRKEINKNAKHEIKIEYCGGSKTYLVSLVEGKKLITSSIAYNKQTAEEYALRLTLNVETDKAHSVSIDMRKRTNNRASGHRNGGDRRMHRATGFAEDNEEMFNLDISQETENETENATVIQSIGTSFGYSAVPF